MTDKPLRTLIVDDEPLALERMEIICRDIAGIEVAGTAQDGAAALRQIGALAPDLVLLDMTMPELDGLAVRAPSPGRKMPRQLSSSLRMTISRSRRSIWKRSTMS